MASYHRRLQSSRNIPSTKLCVVFRNVTNSKRLTGSAFAATVAGGTPTVSILSATFCSVYSQQSSYLKAVTSILNLTRRYAAKIRRTE